MWFWALIDPCHFQRFTLRCAFRRWIFFTLLKLPKCLPPGPLGSVVLGQNMDVSGRLDSPRVKLYEQTVTRGAWRSIFCLFVSKTASQHATFCSCALPHCPSFVVSRLLSTRGFGSRANPRAHLRTRRVSARREARLTSRVRERRKDTCGRLGSRGVHHRSELLVRTLPR